MKKIILGILMLFLSASTAFAAGRAILSWDANMEADLAGYRIYQSKTAGMGYVKVADVPKLLGDSVPTFTITPLVDGTYFWVVTAYDISGNESGFSNEVTKTIDSTPPAPPSNLRALIEKIIAFIKKLFNIG